MLFRFALAAVLSLIAGSVALAAEAAAPHDAGPAGTAVAAADPAAPGAAPAATAKASPVSPAAEAATPPGAARKAADAADPRQQRLAALQQVATRTSLKYLPRLRPYASNYPRLVGAVLGYWRRHTASPSAERLTDIIMHYVKDEYRLFARPQILAGVSEGVAALRAELRRL